MQAEIGDPACSKRTTDFEVLPHFTFPRLQGISLVPGRLLRLGSGRRWTALTVLAASRPPLAHRNRQGCPRVPRPQNPQAGFPSVPFLPCEQGEPGTPPSTLSRIDRGVLSKIRPPDPGPGSGPWPVRTRHRSPGILRCARRCRRILPGRHHRAVFHQVREGQAKPTGPGDVVSGLTFGPPPKK